MGVLGLWVRTVPDLVVHGTMERIGGRTGGPRSGGGVVREAVRSVLRSRRLGVTVVTTLALGIGATVALFSLLEGVLLAPLPYPEPDRLVQFWETNPEVEDDRLGPSPLNFVDWEREAGALDYMAAVYLTSGTYRTDEWAEELRSAQVSPDFFKVLGVQPLLGEDFREEEVDRYGPVMLSYRTWQRLFGGDPSVVGRTILSSGSPYRIAGVMPPDFAFPDESVETWVAWSLPNVYADRPEMRSARFLQGIGRLAPGASLQGAESQLRGIAASLSEAHPEANRGWSVAVTRLHDDIVGSVRGTLWFAFGAVLCVLIIACANVANLLLARVPKRGRELAIRAALGADRRRLLRVLMLESLLLALLAGALGLVVGWGLLEALVAVDAGGIPRLDEVGLNRWVLLFTLVVSSGTALVFGLTPAVHALGVQATSSLRDGGRNTGSPRQRRSREAFVAGQVAVAVALLAGAGLFRESLRQVRGVNPGFVTENALTFRISLDPTDSESIWRYYDTLVDRLEALPGVQRAGASQTLPINPVGNDFRRPYRPSGSSVASADAPVVQMRIVDSGYRDAMGMTLLEGADIPATAAEGQPLVAVINRILAERLWPGRSAVGETFEVDFRRGWQPYTVTGVVEDVRHYGPREAPRPEVFLSARQNPYLAMSLVVRTSRPPEALIPEVREVVLSHVPVQPAHSFVTMERLREDSVAAERFLAVVFAVFSGIAFLLAAGGVYGVVAFGVSHQRREIGLRMALGAHAGTVVRGVVRRAAVLAVVGLLVGCGLVVAVSGPAANLLYDVAPWDPGTLSRVAVMILGTAILAAYLPARRAGQVEPVEALRADG